MAKHGRRVGAPPMPHPIGHTLRALARWAVAASLGVPAACADDRDAQDVSQVVPPAGRTGAPAPVTSSPSSAIPESADTRAVPLADAAASEPADARPAARDAADPGDDAGAMPPAGAWAPIACDFYNADIFGRSFKLAREVDYFGLYRMRPARYGMAVEPPEVNRHDSLGMECATSLDAASCNERLKALLVVSEQCKTQGLCTSFGVTTRGDEVKRFDDHAELMALLGTIDSPEKAAVVAFWEEMVLACRREDTSMGTRISHPGNWLVQSVWYACPDQVERTLEIDAAGNVVSDELKKLKEMYCATGRRPEGLVPSARSASPRSALGAYFADVAQLEAASVCAFQRIAGELRTFAAPLQLIAAAEAAARDEIRHARAMAELAASFGAAPQPPRIEPQAPRTRWAFALDNAREGCVRETFGALLAHHQAALARDPAIAASMARIAEDETRHAELSWQIAAWLEPQLSAAEQAALHSARAAELRKLSCDLGAGELSDPDRAAAGLPSPALSRAMLERLAGSGFVQSGRRQHT